MCRLSLTARREYEFIVNTVLNTIKWDTKPISWLWITKRKNALSGYSANVPTPFWLCFFQLPSFPDILSYVFVNCDLKKCTLSKSYFNKSCELGLPQNVQKMQLGVRKASCMDSLECETVDNPNVSAANRTNRTNNTQQLEQIVQIVNVLCHN